MARLWRVFHADLPARRDEPVTLDRTESHHLCRVLRLSPGERIAVFDGRGSEWEATLVEARAAAAVLRLEQPLDAAVEPSIDVTLLQAFCRAERMEWVVQKATELGVGAVIGWPAERTEPAATRAARPERWTRIAIEAAKQCGRRRLPELSRAGELPQPPAAALGLLLEPSAGVPALGAFLREGPPRPVWLAVGPEAGLSDAEIERALARGWRAASLGPRTLRAETAGVAATAIVLHRWGDLGAG